MGENLRVLVIFRMHAAGKKKRGRGVRLRGQRHLSSEGTLLACFFNP